MPSCLERNVYLKSHLHSRQRHPSHMSPRHGLRILDLQILDLRHMSLRHGLRILDLQILDLRTLQQESACFSANMRLCHACEDVVERQGSRALKGRSWAHRALFGQNGRHQVPHYLHSRRLSYHHQVPDYLHNHRLSYHHRSRSHLHGQRIHLNQSLCCRRCSLHVGRHRGRTQWIHHSLNFGCPRSPRSLDHFRYSHLDGRRRTVNWSVYRVLEECVVDTAEAEIRRC